MITKHLLITGRVQGVCYRVWFEQQARIHGVSGWVRNKPDGDVESLIHGEEKAVQAMIDKANEGPQLAEVTQVKVSDAPNDDLNSFEIRATE